MYNSISQDFQKNCEGGTRVFRENCIKIPQSNLYVVYIRFVYVALVNCLLAVTTKFHTLIKFYSTTCSPIFIKILREKQGVSLLLGNSRFNTQNRLYVSYIKFVKVG